MTVSSGLSRHFRKYAREQPVWLCLLPALLLWPWLDKAFHIDDTQFLIYARLIRESPLNPFLQVFEWDSMRVAIIDFPHPLFWQYLLSGITVVFGESEVALHGLTFCFALLALHSIRGLALRLAVPPLAACALVAGSSGFLVMGSTIMPDLAAMALSFAAVDRGVAAVETGKNRDALWAGLFAALGFLTRFTALFGVGLLLLYPLIRRAKHRSAYLPFAIAISIVIASECLSIALAGRPHFLSSLGRWTADSNLSRDLGFAFDELTFLGAQIPMTGIALFAIASAGRSPRLIVAVAGLAAVGISWWVAGDSSLVIAAVLFAWSGLALVLDSALRLVDALRLRLHALDAATALRWVLALTVVTTTFATIRYEHVAVKYLLLPLPAATLLMLDRIGHLQGRLRKTASALMWVSIAVGIGVGTAVALSDYRWANTYRDFVDGELVQRESRGGKQYLNAQWGLRYYAERAGLEPYRGEKLGPEDELIVSTTVPPNWAVLELPQTVTARYELHYPGPFALLSLEKAAGFYSNYWGSYPFVPTNRVTDEILILRASPR